MIGLLQNLRRTLRQQQWIRPDMYAWRRSGLSLTFALLAIVAMTGCETIPVVTPPQPPLCDASDTLFEVFDALEDTDNPCHEWIDETHGRVARSGSASAAVWSRTTQAGTALLVSAVHTLGVGWFGPANTDIDAALRDPSEEIGVGRLVYVSPTGGTLEPFTSPMFDFFNLETPADQNNNFFANILPRYDAFVAVVDDQKLAQTLVPQQPSELQSAPPDIYDPMDRTTTSPTFTDVEADDLVMAIGFPAEGALAGQMAGSIGRVLSVTEIASVLQTLADAGDEEGFIAYDPEVEFIFRGPAASGMSGGGVFDDSGVLVGVLVRASDPLDGVQYVRAVRMSFLVGELLNTFDALPQDQQDTIAPYLESLP